MLKEWKVDWGGIEDMGRQIKSSKQWEEVDVRRNEKHDSHSKWKRIYALKTKQTIARIKLKINRFQWLKRKNTLRRTIVN